MNRWVWITFIGFFAAGLAMVFYFGLQPKPVKMLKPSYFNSPEEVGQLIFTRYQDRFQNENKVVFGITPGVDEHERVAKSFYMQASQSGAPFTHAAREERLGFTIWEEASLWPGFDVHNRPQIWLEDVRKNETAKSFYLLPNLYTSHLIGETPLISLEKSYGKKITTITIVGFVLAMKNLQQIFPACDGRAVLGEASAAALGCAAKRASLSVFRKNMDSRRVVAQMEQTGEKDFLVYLWTP